MALPGSAWEHVSSSGASTRQGAHSERVQPWPPRDAFERRASAQVGGVSERQRGSQVRSAAATVGHAQSARPGGWRRHSKRHAPRRNLEAPVAFKGSMIH